jgi:hypothetical protein
MAKEGQKTRIKIGLDGPYGAPAQRFYDFEYSMVFGWVNSTHISESSLTKAVQALAPHRSVVS